jgi:hypothetical protein
MKVLCVCRNGNSRSVALAWLLKHKHGQDALAMGLRKNSHETQQMLYEWADLIILTAGKYAGEIPDVYTAKLRIWDVGSDVWFKGFAPDLVEHYQHFIKTKGLK